MTALRHAVVTARRFRAAAIQLEDPRWRPWAAYFRIAPPDARCRFDVLVLRIIAELPLDGSLRFPPGLFFRALLSGVVPHGFDTIPESAAPASP